jgi:serine protease AprX
LLSSDEQPLQLVAPPSTAKNAISVGYIELVWKVDGKGEFTLSSFLNQATPRSLITDVVPEITISDFSNPGPTDDGRIKPDLVAVGRAIGGATDCTTPLTPTDSCYDWSDGTSMAAPFVSGAVILLQNTAKIRYNEYLRSDAIKAVLINGVRNDYGGRPNWWMGWGMADYCKARKAVLDTGGLSFRYYELDAESRLPIPAEVINEVDDGCGVNGNKPIISTTLVWNDVPSENNTLDEGQGPILDINLDVVFHYNNKIRLPWTLDINDTCEKNNLDECGRLDNDDKNNVVKVTLDKSEIAEDSQVTIEIFNKSKKPVKFAVAFRGLRPLN